MKNLAGYSTVENIGTVHWFRTITSEACRMGEFIADNPNNYNNSEYGRRIQNINKDLIEWQETNQPLKK